MSEHILGPLYTEVMGPEDAPPMVFIPPNPMDNSCWIYQMAHFSTWYRCIAVDTPGYGRSPRALPGVTREELADAVWEIVDANSIGGPTVLVGCSLGSRIAPFMYHRRPEQTAAIVLSGTSYNPGEPPHVEKRVTQYREHGIDWRYHHTFEDLSPEFGETELATWLAETMTERNGTSDVESIINVFESGRPGDPEWLLEDLHAPVLILSGERDNSHPRVFGLAERLPDVKLITLDGAGHACMFEQPWVYDAHLLDFLRERLPEELRPTPELAARFGAAPAIVS